MYPVNQVILGGDSVFNPLDDIDMQIQKMEVYKKKLQQLKNTQTVQQQALIWDSIDKEMTSLTEEQKNKFFLDEDYVEVYTKIQNLVQTELLNLVKSKIESTSEGKDLMNKQLSLVKKLKVKIVEDTNKEMQTFNKFREYSKDNPGITYEEFIKTLCNE